MLETTSDSKSGPEFVEKFFTERELHVLDEKSGTGEVDKDRFDEWFREVEKTFKKLPLYQDSAWEKLKVVINFLHNKLFSKNDDSDEKDKTPQELTIWFFRGQSNSNYSFHSSLYRHFKRNYEEKNDKEAKFESLDVDNQEKILRNAREELIQKAQEHGFNRNLSNLHIEALLQHHGTPTRLIDVTLDWRVALYFACKEDVDKDGRLFILASPYTFETLVKEQLDAKGVPYASDKAYLVLLAHFDSRMIAQQAFFINGKLPKENKNNIRYNDDELKLNEIREIMSVSINFRKDGKLTKVNDLLQPETSPQNYEDIIGYSIRIPREFKRRILKKLEEEGICEDSLFPPLLETKRLFKETVTKSFDESIKELSKQEDE